jgi:hypothetical protein
LTPWGRGGIIGLLKVTLFWGGIEMEVSGVLFDLYSTLIQHDNADLAWSRWRTCFGDFLQQKGVHLDTDFDFWLSFWQEDFVPLNDMSPFENRIKHFCDKLNVSLNREQITALTNMGMHRAT